MTVSPQRRRCACAFLSTSFGFGPVSKAVTIAQELKRRVPFSELHYFGSGIAYEYVCKSAVFDQSIVVNVDNRNAVEYLIPHLRSYDFVISVLNFEILPLWSRVDFPPLYLVDSLAWMWPALPNGIDSVTAYFIQSYLMSNDRVQAWRTKIPLVLVGPIQPDLDIYVSTTDKRELLVNFSGCANPFAPPELFVSYVEVLTQAVLEHSREFDWLTFCCNEHLSGCIRHIVGDSKYITVGHLTHCQFLEKLVNASAVLTAPGITTTLEADSLCKPSRFLLPQNYSQALMSERYRCLLGDRSGMALTRFGQEFLADLNLPEEHGVSQVIVSLEKILTFRKNDICQMVGELLEDAKVNGRLSLPIPTEEGCPYKGQKMIVDLCIGSLS
jgi:hypothetical protein